jgi:hypothetical protein
MCCVIFFLHYMQVIKFLIEIKIQIFVELNGMIKKLKLALYRNKIIDLQGCGPSTS